MSEKMMTIKHFFMLSRQDVLDTTPVVLREVRLRDFNEVLKV